MANLPGDVVEYKPYGIFFIIDGYDDVDDFLTWHLSKDAKRQVIRMYNMRQFVGDSLDIRIIKLLLRRYTSIENFMKIYLFAIAVVLMHLSCVKESFETSSNADLTFSVDTLHFDTVFTQVGSATRSFKIFNNESKSLKLDRVYLESGANSKFRMNVDGIDGNEVGKVEIRPNDSIYVFVEVTVDPDQPLSTSPFVIEERLFVDVNGSTRSILVDAWGQNANYIPNRFNGGETYRLSCDNGLIIWDDPKPYVIYGQLLIDSCTLRMASGLRVHVHGGIARGYTADSTLFFFNDGNILVGQNGTIQCLGTTSNPVVIGGDRLESEFVSTPGQWSGIRLLPGSKDNLIRGTVIHNSVFGVYVDSLCSIEMATSRVFNTSSVGLFAYHAEKVIARNCLFYNNGSFGFLGRFGGNYEFEYCTFANGNNDMEAAFVTNHFCFDFPECNVWPTNELNASFTNCIITGHDRDEFWISEREGESANLSMTNCIVRVQELINTQNIPEFKNLYTTDCLLRQTNDSLFVDMADGDLHLDTLSIAEKRAKPNINLRFDLDGNLRDVRNPDVGCYEYQY